MSTKESNQILINVQNWVSNKIYTESVTVTAMYLKPFQNNDPNDWKFSAEYYNSVEIVSSDSSGDSPGYFVAQC